MSHDYATAVQIAALNDRFRQRLQIPVFGDDGLRGHHVMTRGFTNLPPMVQIEICALIRAQADFNIDNDPYGEHDFGAIRHKAALVFWKIEYYSDETCRYDTSTPHDPEKCFRVMTVMLTDEW